MLFSHIQKDKYNYILSLYLSYDSNCKIFHEFMCVRTGKQMVRDIPEVADSNSACVKTLIKFYAVYWIL